MSGGSKLDQLMASVPSLPVIVQELQKELSDLNSTPKSIENILNKDTALSVRLLKVANSAFYGLSSKVSTVSQALMMIGIGELRSLVMASCMTKIFGGVKNNVVDMESFWRHSVATGVCARQLANARREPHAEQFFLAGLIHDLGRLVMFRSLPEKAEKAYEIAIAKKLDITQVEGELLNFNHADLAGRVLREWKFPESTVFIVAGHHKPMLAGKYSNQAAIMHVADVICDAIQIGSSGEGTIAPNPSVTADFFQGDLSVIHSIIDDTETMTDEIVKIFLDD